MTTALEIIRRGLRLINVPGRGALLSSADAQAGLETLQGILNTEAVSKFFVPGIRRHFFALTAAKAIYSYGPGADLDTTLFEDPVPAQIESAYIRAGSSIQTNELITDGRFANSAAWTLDAGWNITNNAARLSSGNSGAAIVQALTVAAVTYTVRISVTRRAGGVRLLLVTPGANLSQSIMVSGDYSFTVSPSSGSPTQVSIIALDADSDVDVTLLSVIPVGVCAVGLPDGQGTDYPIEFIDQKRYNANSSKGRNGRPCEALWSRGYPFAELRFDSAPSSGDILVADVLVNRVGVSSLTSEVRLHSDAMKWLQYRLAFEAAPEYGKALAPSARMVMEEAWSRLTAANHRPNMLRVDKGLRSRPSFDINRGDV